MLKKTRSVSTTSTRATVRTTTSSEISFESSTSGGRHGPSACYSDASTALSIYSTDNPSNRLSSACTESYVEDSCIDNNDAYEDVDVIDELYDFFSNPANMGTIGFDLGSSNRERTLKELYDTEGRYIAKLQAAIDHYRKPMLGSFRQSSNPAQANSRNFLLPSKSSGAVRGDDTEVVFGNIDELLVLSRKLYNGLKDRFRIWGPTQLVADVIEPLVLDTHCYVSYYENYGQAMSILERLSRTPTTKKYFEPMVDTGGNSSQSSLFSLLSLPLRSIPRYSKLLKDLMLHTDPHHPDAKKLGQCSWRMSCLEKSIGPLLQKCQNVSRLVDMICLIRNCPVLLDEPRYFVMRGQLTNSSPGSYSNKDDRRIYFLLSDMLIFVRPQSDSSSSGLYFKGKIELKDAVIRELPQKKLNHPHAFEITINSSDPDDKYADDIDALLAAAGGATVETYYLKADSREALSIWMTELQNVIHRLKTLQRRP
ncbi:Dbl homology domain-containing protein [Dichotomocladium elegans]|nr:Dbl homology domain-containing protein [Dichotomocladium elegans]